ncbi:MAG: phosphoribosylglycinamide formyltransferase [Deferribacterales bacterium]|uniref:phosphoribosylglycinamide formyltransferase n=1 Tax=Deferrivibrio essentukiensis TaxID=2880922 RepID=UPI00199B204C|nr:phosphoribosylglycinamide formyltransferase [Deferrivibrio essentukiensis]MBC7197592.1 phosphoribosylglycinamide formyltransferase [Deferribacterales bacterium]MBZ4672788.1 purN [Deferribacteraceae bacterium]MCB4204884.1 phosphoribosylglycinamide formyltransferase [Deferrivibrio essentukiensis]
MKRIAILLSGRGSNFKAIYEAINSGFIKDAEISVVISDKKEAKGLEFARDNGLNAIFVNPKDFGDRKGYDLELVKILKNANVDIICLAGFMRIISEEFVNAFENKIINIHPSLLPSFPGLNAQKQALEYGVKFTGCTVHFVDAKVDNGPIILQAVVEVKQDDTVETLSDRILKYEHKIYPMAVKLLVEDKIKVEGRKVIIFD